MMQEICRKACYALTFVLVACLVYSGIFLAGTLASNYEGPKILAFVIFMVTFGSVIGLMFASKPLVHLILRKTGRHSPALIARLKSVEAAIELGVGKYPTFCLVELAGSVAIALISLYLLCGGALLAGQVEWLHPVSAIATAVVLIPGLVFYGSQLAWSIANKIDPQVV